MSSSTLDSRWATTTDRRKADEGLPSTRYTEALRVNNDLHPESTSPVTTKTSAGTTSSSFSSPTTTSLDSRWATPHDSYKAERGLLATRYSEAIANAQIDLHPQHERERKESSAKWGDDGNQTLEQKQKPDDQQWWRPANNNNNSNNDDTRNRYRDFPREKNNSYGNRNQSSSSMDAYRASMDSYNNNRYSYNSNRYHDQQQRRSQYGENPPSSYSGPSVANQRFSQQQHQQRQQPIPRQYEPMSSRPWNLIAMKKKEDSNNITNTSNPLSYPKSYITSSDDDPSQQEQRQSHNWSAESTYDGDYIDDIIVSDIPVTSFKTYKEWSEEQRQKSATYTEGNELLEILIKGRDGQDRYEKNYNDNINIDTTTTARAVTTTKDYGASAAWSNISRNNQQSGNDTRSPRCILEPTNDKPTCNGDNAKLLGDISAAPRQIEQEQLRNSVDIDSANSSTSNIPLNDGGQKISIATSIQGTVQSGDNSPNPSADISSPSWDPNGKKPWDHDDSGPQQSSYNTMQRNNTPSQNAQNFKTSPVIRSESSSSWNNNTALAASPPPNDTLPRNAQIHTPQPIMHSATSWNPNAPRPWDEPSPRPAPLSQWNNNSQRNSMPPLPEQRQVAESGNDNNRGNWNQGTGSHSTCDIQRNSGYSSEYSTRGPTAQRQL